MATRNSKVYIPASSADDWQQFLADPAKQWKTGYSARTMAYSWQEANGIPDEVQAVLSQDESLRKMEALLVIPEHQVPLPGGRRASQNDAWVLARAGSSLVSIAVEGKVNESFGPTLGEWGPDSSSGKRERYSYLCDQLGLSQSIDEAIRYQFLHRTASALIEARRFNASRAIMLVHSFSQVDEGIQDYKNFLSLFGASGSVNQLISVGERGGVDLSLCWVRGDKRYLDK